ncbi:MAG: hypothetical protein JSR82_01735 [Verrucomicrobia bacterium]|nr:hypothetical protein [Verrucomicrobiota bacterium]
MRAVSVALLLAFAGSVGAQNSAPRQSNGGLATERRELIDALGAAELPEAFKLLRQYYIDPGALKDESLQRAQLEGLLARLGPGARLAPRRTTAEPAAKADPASPYRAEVLKGRIGCIRLGALSRENLSLLDQTLRDYAQQKIPHLIFDLRATPAATDFDLAAQVINRFAPKGRPLFSLRKPNGKDERLFTSNADPLYSGFVVVVVDAGTVGAAEIVAAGVRLNTRSMTVGTATGGQAVEYADLALGQETLLRVAVAEAVPSAGPRIFPEGVKPDLTVEGAPSGAERERVLKAALDKTGFAGVLDDPERMRINEASLVAGLNPEVELLQEAQRRRGKPVTIIPRDVVLQRAVDTVTTVTSLEPR